jgi:hypothetical protein
MPSEKCMNMGENFFSATEYVEVDLCDKPSKQTEA